MKICPRCQRTYIDDNLNFCLDDGVVLQKSGGNEAPETVLMTHARQTGEAAGSAPTTASPAWSTSPQNFQPIAKKKKSKTWLWVLLIFGLVILFCGGGAVGLFIYVASTVDTEVAANNKTISNSKTITLANNNKSSPGNTTSSDDRNNVQDIDLSEWVRDFSAYGTTEFSNGELIMSEGSTLSPK